MAALDVATTDDGKDRWIAKAAPAIFLVLWSSGFGFAKAGLEHTGPMTLLAWRYGLVVAVLVPAFIILRPRLPSSRSAWIHLIAVGFLIQVVYFGLGIVSMAMGVSAGVAAVIASLQPVAVALASPAVTGEKIGWLKWTGIFIGLSGAIVVITTGSHFSANLELALLLSAGAMLAMAGATLYQKRFGSHEHVITASLVQYVTGFAVVAPLSLGLEQGRTDWTMEFGVALAYLVVANSLIAISLLMLMIRRGQASKVSSLFFLVPPMAALSGWLLLGELLTPMSLLGMAIAAVGVGIVLRS